LAKSSRKQIEADEIKVLVELQKNCKDSLDKIAKRCGFSRQKTWRILKHLEKNKTIWGYTAVLDEERIGMKRYFLLVKGKNLPIDNEIEKNITDRQLDKAVAKLGIILDDSYWLHGTFDGMVVFSAEDIKTAKKFIDIFKELYKESLNITDLQLIEKIVTIKKNGFINPRIKETKRLLE